MGRLVDALLGLSGAPAYALVGLLVFGEAAAFIGLVVPGEIAALLGGVLASNGQVSLPAMLAVACLAAIVGDSVGYEVGRHLGPRILSRPGIARRIGPKVERASAYLEERGGRAVVLGRWTSVLRALIPGLAGMARMPYPRFLLFNVVGGVAWASTFVVLGYLAGASWRQVERVAGRASLVLLALLVAGVAVRWATRRLVARADQVQERLRELGRTRPVRWIEARFSRPIAWTRARTTPGTARGLGWSVSVLAAGSAAWVMGIAVQDLLAGEELASVDRPLAAWVTAHSTPEAVAIAGTLSRLLAPPAGIALLALVGLVLWRWLRDPRGAGRAVAAALLASGVALLLQRLLPTSVAGTRFPAVSVTLVAALLAATLPTVAARAGLRPAIRIAGAGVLVLVLAATAELLAGDAALSGVVGGLGLGALVGLGGELTSRALAEGPRPVEARP